MRTFVRRTAGLLLLAGFVGLALCHDNPSWPPPGLVGEQYGSAVVGGIIFGTVASIGVLVRLVPGNIPNVDSPFTPELMLIPALGYSTGATVGVCAAGDAVQAGGNGWAALAGSVLGGAVGGLLALSTRKVAWYSTSVVLAPAGAVLGYNLKRPAGADESASRLGAPMLLFSPDPAGAKLDFRPVSISF